MPIVFGCRKFSLRVLISICLNFLPIPAWRCLKVLHIRKKACSEAYCRKASLMLRVSYNTFIQIKRFILPLKKTVEKFPLKKFVSREKCPQKIASDKPPLPENSLQGIKLSFRKFKLYFRPNMIRWTIRPHNLKGLLTVGSC